MPLPYENERVNLIKVAFYRAASNNTKRGDAMNIIHSLSDGPVIMYRCITSIQFMMGMPTEQGLNNS